MAAAVFSGTVSAAESVPGSVAPPDEMLEQDLAGLDDRELLDIVRFSPPASARRAAAGEVLVSRYQGLVWSCVRRYLSSPELAEDLMQVGYVGLLMAMSRFDPAVGCNLATYARPCISGELKRYFRDKRWQARGAELVFQTCSLDAPLGSEPYMGTLADYLGQEDPRIEHMLSMQAVAAHWGELSPREQEILLLDCRGGMTQVQIGQRLSISQMRVSRLRAHALGYLRSRLLDPEELSTAAPRTGG